MRPLRLEVKGFTAFRDPQAIDFTELDVFAIAGPTGSGKSSLLDAMTYALYGRVERVGDRVSQLISQGQPRMAVTLEFEVGRDRFRVTRSTPAKGATKIQLERLADGRWDQAGEGSDRVREAERLIVGAIGLTYDGFTRSVLLPQGRFAELLSGEPQKRRDILTELLGLSLFKRMAERAGAISRDASVRAQTTADLVDREFGDATAEALKEARGAAREAVKREKALTKAAEQVVNVLQRWQESRRSVEELRTCAEETAAQVRHAEGVRLELATLAPEHDGAVRLARERAAASEAARRAHAEAEAAIQTAEASLGRHEDLLRAQVRANALMEARRASAARSSERERSRGQAGILREGAAAAEGVLAQAMEVLAAAERDRADAEGALEQARHADLVSTVAAAVHVGDPCPVCGAPLEKLPKRTGADGLRRATKARHAAERTVEAARAAGAGAERGVDATRRDLETNAAEDHRLAAEIESLRSRIQADEEVLQATLGSPVPDDPAGVIDTRLAELRRLDAAEREAAAMAAQAVHTQLEAEGERSRIASLVERHRDRMTVDHNPLARRAARALGDRIPIRLPEPPGADDPPALGRFARDIAEALRALSARLAGQVEERSSAEAGLLDEARGAVAGLVEPAASLEALATEVSAACRSATAQVATTSQRAADLAERLERKQQLAREAAQAGGRATLFRALALELRADRLIAFLQVEALQVLATAGSERLADLSDGRYGLVCRDDEFLVVDTWNGDEERSVRTLSGGETFLAALALALALADQVRSLSVTDRARLDSLFLDEGFGTLDQAALEVVVEAIERLGGGGRLVGVITHVRDLAEQFPRLEVLKSPRGSTVSLVPA